MEGCLFFQLKVKTLLFLMILYEKLHTKVLQKMTGSSFAPNFRHVDKFIR